MTRHDRRNGSGPGKQPSGGMAWNTELEDWPSPEPLDEVGIYNMSMFATDSIFLSTSSLPALISPEPSVSLPQAQAPSPRSRLPELHMHLSPSTALLVLSTLTPRTTSSALPVTNPPQPVVTSIPPTASPEAHVHRLFNISGIGFENLAIRSNGEILATTAFPWALLWYIDPLSIRPPVLLHNFTSLASTGGITELAPDFFYFTASGTNGSHHVHTVDMRPFIPLPDGTIFTPPIIREAGSIPEAVLTNGMTHLRRSDDFVLIADTSLGAVWKFDAHTGKSKLVIQDPSMKGPANKTSFAGFGINGLRAQNQTLFYCNSGKQQMWKMPLHADGSSADNATLITSGLSCDDFALDPWGFAYVASPSNALIKVDTRTGAQLSVAGTFHSNASDIISASSVRFGRGPSDRTSVYVTTNGGSFTDAPLGSQGITRVDVSDLAEVFAGMKGG